MSAETANGDAAALQAEGDRNSRRYQAQARKALASMQEAAANRQARGAANNASQRTDADILFDREPDAYDKYLHGPKNTLEQRDE